MGKHMHIACMRELLLDAVVCGASACAELNSSRVTVHLLACEDATYATVRDWVWWSLAAEFIGQRDTGWWRWFGHVNLCPYCFRMNL
jgi:hypothetical protein